MKVIIAGSRTITDYDIVKKAITEAKITCGFSITEVVSGGAYGVDRLGEKWAKENGIPIKKFLPNWDQYGKSAGIRRNIEMAEYADGLIVLIQGGSKGSSHMFQEATKKGLKVFKKEI